MSSIFLSSGDLSGEQYAELLIDEIHKIDKSIYFYATAGEVLKKKRNVEVISDISRNAPIGITEAFKTIDFYRENLKKVENILKRSEIKVVILIDFPDFNFEIAKIAKRFNIPVIYYIIPQVWAWRKRRIEFLKKFTDRIFVIFEFEKELLQKYNLNCFYFGHPLLDIINREKESYLKAPFDREANDIVFGLFPGSRLTTFKHLFPILLNAYKIIKSQMPNAKFVMGLTYLFSGDTLSVFRRHYQNQKSIDEFYQDVKILFGQTRRIIYNSNVVIVPTGTITMEAFFLGIPMVTFNKVSLLSWLFGKLLVNSKYLAMPNILANERIVPEYIQFDATSRNIARESIKIVSDTTYRERMLQKLSKLRSGIEKESNNVSMRIANEIMEAYF